MPDLESVQPCLIQVTDLVPNNIRAEAKATKHAKTDKVTPVVAVMPIFGETKCNSPNAKAENSLKRPN
jgi:hypothetical protein